MECVEPNDVILLTKGMTVMYPTLPVWFFKDYHPYSTETTDAIMTVGEVRKRRSTIHTLQEDLKKMFRFALAYHRVPYDDAVLTRYVNYLIPPTKNDTFVIPPGEYLVTDVQRKERERKVFCQTFDPFGNSPMIKLYFYQNSGYHATEDKVKVVRRVL